MILYLLFFPFPAMIKRNNTGERDGRGGSVDITICHSLAVSENFRAFCGPWVSGIFGGRLCAGLPVGKRAKGLGYLYGSAAGAGAGIVSEGEGYSHRAAARYCDGTLGRLACRDYHLSDRRRL